METGVLARSLYLISRSEACRHVIAYWIFVLSILLVIDILAMPLLENPTAVVSIASYLLIRTVALALMSFEPVAFRIAYRLRINLDTLYAIGEDLEYVKLSEALLVGSIMIMTMMVGIVYAFHNNFYGMVAADIILLGIVLLNVALLSLLLKPKFIAFVAAVFASLAAVYVVLMPILYGELTLSMMSIALVCSDAFAILGLNVAGVLTCLDVTKLSES